MGGLGLIPGSARSSGEGNTPVFLPAESYGQKNLVGYSPWSHKEFSTTKWLTLSFFFFPGDLPDPGIEPMSPALAGRFCTTESLRNITDTQISVTAQLLASSATWQGHAEQRGGWVTGDEQAPSPKRCLYSEYDCSQNSRSGFKYWDFNLHLLVSS